MTNPKDLETFRNEWKKELSGSVAKRESTVHALPRPQEPVKESDKLHDDREQQQSAGVILHRSRSVQDVDRNEENTEQTYYPFMILGKLLKEGSNVASEEPSDSEKNILLGSPDRKRKYFDDETSVCGQRLAKRHIDSNKSLHQGDHLKSVKHKTQPEKPERYLDLFIADLDEINEIPFFDITLPREVAVNIFKFLDITDLCHCAQVSRSWRSLANDELLWCQISHSLGFELDACTLEKTNWKQEVQQYMSNRRTLKANWKNRTGKVFQFNHTQGGILSAVSSSGSNVVSGYMNGDVKLWDVRKGGNCVFQPSSTALQIDENYDEGTISNYVLQVETSSQVTVASYSHRHVDVWLNEYGLQPVSTFRCEGGWDITSLKLANHDPVFALAQGYYVIVYRANDNSSFSLVEKIDLNKMVSHIKWLEPSSPQFNTVSVLAVATSNIVNLYQPGAVGRGDKAMSEIHNIIDCPVTCLDLQTEPDEMAVACGMFGGPTEAFKIHLYDLSTGRLTTSLQGHTWMVTCLNMKDSPTHHIITGCGDRKVRLYDMRQSTWPAMTLLGHCGKITTVQMDGWKVVSGDEGGFVRVWDQRMGAKLWELHSRHPVQYCHFTDDLLVVGNVPSDKFPFVNDEFDRVTHSRYRGTVQIYDFSTDQQTEGIPDICHSSYDAPETYNYNIGLAVPYDTI